MAKNPKTSKPKQAAPKKKAKPIYCNLSENEASMDAMVSMLNKDGIIEYTEFDFTRAQCNDCQKEIRAAFAKHGFAGKLGILVRFVKGHGTVATAYDRSVFTEDAAEKLVLGNL